MWAIDAFFDKELTYFESQSPVSDSIIEPQSLLTQILSSEFDSVSIPCHCNSAISMAVIKSIKAKAGRACMQLNPDYTLSYQLMLNLHEIHNLDQAFSILRYPSLTEGYGNGTSFMKKGDQAKAFMLDNVDWVKRTDKYTDVRIGSNHFGLDVILKDMYYVLEQYSFNVNDLMHQDQRHINYYLFTYLELIFRTNMGVNIDSELKLWKDSLLQEERLIQDAVYAGTRKFNIRFAYIRLKRALLSIPIIKNFTHMLGDKLFRSHGKIFHSIEDLLNKTTIG